MSQRVGWSYPARGLRLVGGFLRGRPVHAIVQVSNLCNLSCGFCAFWERPARREHELSLADFETLSSRLAEGGTMVVSLEGGEPLLRRDIVDIVRAFARYHHPILFSNGWRVTPALAGELWRAGLDTIGISIDYPDPVRHDAHRGRPGTFDAALRALSVLRDSAPGGRRQVAVMTVLMEDNQDDLEALLELSARHGVNHQITLISTGGDGRHDHAQRRPRQGIGAELVALKRRFPHLIAFTGYLASIDEFLAGRVQSQCRAGERFLNIDHMGEVSPCIEKLHLRAGNLVHEPWALVYARLAALEEPRTCQACMTSCRGFVDEMSGWPRLRSYREFLFDLSSPPPSQRVRDSGEVS